MEGFGVTAITALLPVLAVVNTSASLMLPGVLTEMPLIFTLSPMRRLLSDSAQMMRHLDRFAYFLSFLFFF